MSDPIFLLLCVLFVPAAYSILRAVHRSRVSFGELMSHVVPLSEAARRALSTSRDRAVPATWGQVSDLWKVQENSSWLTAAADRYRRVMRACTDAESVQDMNITYSTFLRNRWALTRSLLAAIVNLCLGKIGKERCRVRMANVTRYYANVVILSKEMSEVMDESAVVVLEGQFLPYGT